MMESGKEWNVMVHSIGMEKKKQKPVCFTLWNGMKNCNKTPFLVFDDINFFLYYFNEVEHHYEME